MAVKTELTLDISEYIKSLNTVVDAGKDAANTIANSFKSVGNAGVVPKIDTKDLNNLVSSYNAAKTQASLFLAQQKELSKALAYAGQAGSDAYKEVANNIKRAEIEVSKFNDEVKASEGFLAGLTTEFKKGQADAAGGGGIFGSIAGNLGSLVSPAGLATAAIGAVTAALVDGFAKGSEYNIALGDLSARTGLVGEDLARLKVVAEDAFIGGVGESVAEAAKIAGDAKLIFGDTFDDTELTNFTVQAQAFANLFDKDINEVLLNTGGAIKTFGADGEVFMGQLTAAARKTKQPADDLLDTINEYSPLMKEAGLNSEELFGFIERGAENGLFQTDKLADAIKETNIRLKAGDFATPFKDLTASTSGAAKAVVEQANEIALAAQNGEISTKEALQRSAKLVQDELGKGAIGETLASQIQAAFSGTLAEEIGIENYSKIFSAPIPVDEIRKRGEKAGEELKKATGQYNFFDNITRQYDLFITKFGQGLVSFANDVLAPAFAGWYAYLDEGFIKPLTGVYDELVKAFAPLGDLFAEIFGEGGNAGQIFIEIMQTIGKVVGTLVNIVLIPLKLTFQAIGNVIKAVIGTIQLLKKNFEQAYDSSELFKDIIDGISNAFKAVVGWIGEAIDYVSDFFNTLGKKPEAPFKEVQNSAETTSEAVGELNEELSKDTAVPNTEKTKKEYTDLTDYILGLKDKITDISFQINIAEQDSVIKTLEKQIKEISANPNLTQVAKLNLSIELETQKAISESEKELESLANANKKAIEAIEKEFETKKKGAKKSDIEKAEKLKNELIEAETLRFYDAALKIVNERESKLVDIKTVNGDKIIDYTKKQNEVLRQLQIENISDERERNYQKELLALETKFDTEYDLYKDNKDILLQLEQKFITDYQNLNEKFAAKDIDTTNELLKANLNYITEFNKSIASIQLTDNSGRLDGIKQESRDLKKALENNEITYETYIDKIVDLENEKLALQKKTNSDGIALIVNSSKTFLDNLVTQVTAYADYAERKKAIDEQIYENEKQLKDEALTDETKRLEIQKNIDNLRSKQTDDNLATLGNALAESKSLFAENTLAYKLMAIAQASISTYLAAANQLAMVPVTPFNIVLASLITAAGLANVAKIAGFKKGGYTGDGGTNDTVGVVHGREFVAHATATKTYRDVLERINKNDLSNVFIGANGKIIDGANIGIVHNNITRNDSPRVNTYNRELKRSIDRLSSDIRNNTTNKHTQFGVEIESKLKMRGDNIENGLTKIRRKKLQRG